MITCKIWISKLLFVFNNGLYLSQFCEGNYSVVICIHLKDSVLCNMLWYFCKCSVNKFVFSSDWWLKPSLPLSSLFPLPLISVPSPSLLCFLPLSSLLSPSLLCFLPLFSVLSPSLLCFLLFSDSSPSLLCFRPLSPLSPLSLSAGPGWGSLHVQLGGRSSLLWCCCSI